MDLLDPRQHLKSLDGVRGLAVLMVVCHHLCPWSPESPLGMLCATLWLGVDLFFVLSGFLITGALYNTLHQPHFYRNFYARRALRLMPAYLALVLIVLIVNAFCGGRLTVWAVPYFLYGSNIIRDLRLPIGLVRQIDVSHLWSLAVEEQFYLVWPVLVWLAGTRRRILAMCLAGSAISVILRLIAVEQGHSFLGTPYFELPTRLDSLLLGAALAMLVRSPRATSLLRPARLYAIGAAALVVLLMSFAQARHGSMFSRPLVQYGYLAASVVFASMIGLAVQPRTLISRFGETPFLRALGRCSYGLYLLHLVPVFWYRTALEAAQRMGRSSLQRELLGTAVFMVYFLLCFALANFSYNTLESYFLRRKARFQSAQQERPPLQMAA